ncbi:hypothetical protein LC593_03065 [Nostoc sp. CHAB 5844]|nr:hypothetical protein [Nostoc sp. CHAB 5844]
MHQEEDSSSFYVRVPARVLGCLRGGEITIILFPGHGLVLIPIHEKFDAHKICRDVAMQRLYKKIRFIFKGNWYNRTNSDLSGS